MDNNESALQFRLQGGYTKRYHGIRMLYDDTVGHHSYNVAQILRFIAMDLPPMRRAYLIEAALDHDVAEFIVGDMPAPTKRAIPGLRGALAEYEAKVMAEHGVEPMEAVLTPYEMKLLNAADSMDGMRFCIQERMMGNRYAEEVFFAFHSYVIALELPEDGAAWKFFNFLCAEWARAK